MSAAANQLIVLDTDVIVHLIRNNDVGQRIEREYSLTQRVDRRLYSSISEGELLALSRIWHWGPQKLEKLKDLLGELVRVDVSQADIVAEYANLYAAGRPAGRPCGENDLWIAATAKAVGAMLMTCDKHFEWMHPSLVQVCRIVVDV